MKDNQRPVDETQEARKKAVHDAVPVAKIVMLTTGSVWGSMAALLIPWLSWYENNRLDDRYVRKDPLPYYGKEEADERFVRHGEILTIAESRTLQRSVEETSRQQKVNTRKLEYIEMSAAQSAVTSLREEIAYLREKGERTVQMETRLQAAVEYRDCLMSERTNCDPLRP